MYARFKFTTNLDASALTRTGKKALSTVFGEPEEQPTLDRQEQQTAIKHYAEMQSAPRFPLHLPVAVRSQSGDCTAETTNISANGVLFAMDRDVPVGSLVDFTICLLYTSLSNVEAMSAPIRACGEESFDMVVPAMKIRDFNFTEVTKF